MTIVPVPEIDARRIVTDGFDRLDTKVSASDRNRITNELAGRIRFNPENRKVLVADTAGNPMTDIAADGSVIDIDLVTHLRTLTKAGSKPQATTSDPDNPWMKNSYNRTRQAVITNTDSAKATRLKREAGL